MAEWVTPWAARTVREGMSARAGLRAFREGGGHITDSIWFKAVSEARATIERRGDVVGTDLGSRPAASDMTTWTTRRASGVIQQIEVMAVDRATGVIEAIPFSHRTENGTTWNEAIAAALDTISPEGTDGERQRIIGALPVGVYRMTPEASS